MNPARCAITDFAIKRGPWGKPWITRDGRPLDWPEGVDRPLNGELYERPSDISSTLDTKENLKPYNQAQAVFGVIREKSLAWQFRALVSEYADPWTSAKDEVKSLLRLAEKIGGDEAKAGVGTALHRLAHLRDIEADIIYPVAQLEPWLDVYHEAVSSRFEVLDHEVFVVCDDIEDDGGPHDLRTAGSFDRLLRDKKTDEILCADIKGGRQDNEWAMSVTVQVAIYAHSKRYDQKTGERTPIHDDISLTKGVLIHVPVNGGGDAQCYCYPLDLTYGYRLAQMSVEMKKARRLRVSKRDVLSKAKIQ
jgi:hypothetical protein